MKKNMGIADRIIRLLVAAALILLFVFKVISGTWGIILLIVAGIFILTSVFGFCPLYVPFGIKSFKAK